jgi:hypothetical protein
MYLARTSEPDCARSTTTRHPRAPTEQYASVVVIVAAFILFNPSIMRFAYVVPLATLAPCVAAQAGVFEPQDFNVTAALEKIGVNVSTLPEPEPETSSLGQWWFAPCSLAVGSIGHLKPLSIVPADDECSVHLWIFCSAATKSCLKEHQHMTHSLAHTGLLSRVH